MSPNQNKREFLRLKRKAQQRRKIYVTALIIIGVLVVFGLFAFLPKLISKSANYGSSQGFALGDPGAPVKVVAFSSYSCGHCKSFSESLEKDFIKNYIEKGEVYYRYVNMASNNEQSKMLQKHHIVQQTKINSLNIKVFFTPMQVHQTGFPRKT